MTTIASLPPLSGSTWAPRPHPDAAAAGAVGVGDPLTAHDPAAGEVGAFDVLHQALEVDLRVVDVGGDRGGDLAQVVRRDVRRHPHGDPGGAVDQQVREPRRQHQRLLRRLVVVGPEVDRVGVDVTQQLGGQAPEAGLGVVADKAVGEERVVFAVDPDRVDGLHAGVDHRLHLGVEVVPGHERRDDVAHLLRLDPLHDRVAALLPALDPIDVVAPQPGAAFVETGFAADVIDHERHVVPAQSAAALGDLRQSRLQLRLLGADEADVPLEAAGLTAVADDDLELALFIAADPRHNARLEKKQLHVAGELLAVGGVGNLNRFPGQER